MCQNFTPLGLRLVEYKPLLCSTFLTHKIFCTIGYSELSVWVTIMPFSIWEAQLLKIVSLLSAIYFPFNQLLI